METTQALAELKSLKIVGIDNKVNHFAGKLDGLDEKFDKLISKVKNEVVQVKSDLLNTKEDVKKLRNEFDDLEKGVQQMDLQLHSLENKKLELIRGNLEERIHGLRLQQILLEKHDRKYNVLIYGLEEKKDEKINERIYEFMVNDLGIKKEKADEIPIANVHRIPSSANQRPGEPKRPDPIIIRFIHFADKQFLMSRGSNLAGKRISMLDDLPMPMKDARHNLAMEAYKIRKNEKLQTRIKAYGTDMILETRLNSKDKWQCRKVSHQ